MFNFPSSPGEGQIFNAPSGPTFVFQTPVWRVMGQGQIATIGDSLPASPANGQLHWESDTGILHLYYNDGSSSQWVQVGGIAASLASPFLRTLLTTSGSAFQFDASTLFADIEVIAGGGGGGTAIGSSGAGLIAAGGGGGGGGYVKKLIQVTAAVRAAAKTVTIGAGGVGAVGSVSGTAPGDGGNSVYTDSVNTLTATGGSNAGTNPTVVATVPVGAAGTGGLGTGGDIIVRGGTGSAGVAWGQTLIGAGISAGIAGNGGNAAIGGGGGNGTTASASSAAAALAGNPGLGYGGGGGGSLMRNASAGWVNGGAGAAGVCIITEYR